MRVYNGTGKMTINGRDINDYFGLETLKLLVNSPLVLTETEGKFDVVVNVVGGGCSGQAGAIRHGLSRALLQFNPELRPALKKAGFSSASADCPHYLRTFQYASRLFCTIVCRKSDAPDVVECSKSPWNLLKKQQVRSEYAADHPKANCLSQETFSTRRTSPAF